MNVKRLEGRLLNFWVAKSAGLRYSEEFAGPNRCHDPHSGLWHPHTYNPASDWSHAGPIVSEEWYAIEDMLFEWFGPQWSHIPAIADHPLTWFLRAYVATQYGDEVEDMVEGTSAPLVPLAAHPQHSLERTPAHDQRLVSAVSAWAQRFSW